MGDPLAATHAAEPEHGNATTRKRHPASEGEIDDL
ncbi:hypothetical protein BLA9940_03379 [Burkholderia aenigmatica]|nr:hypothetical protein BLA9940_03379 [Burkholderia aenigmatica]